MLYRELLTDDMSKNYRAIQEILDYTKHIDIFKQEIKKIEGELLRAEALFEDLLNKEVS